jgi:SAM-dependent methyltransferase
MSPRPNTDAVLARVRSMTPAKVRRVLRPFARRLGLAAPIWWQSPRPRSPHLAEQSTRTAVWCNICGWAGQRFDGHAHSESAQCPVCGSIARDRFLFWCFLSRTPWQRSLRVLETSPRLGEEYRSAMRRWFSYRSSDFDLGAHLADIALDLQQIDLPDNSIDILLTPHVLEHVPDTRLALSEIHRILSPGGRMYLQVPLLQGSTAPPLEPEFHADNTKVFWRFGWDLTRTLRESGFDVRVLVPSEFARQLEQSGADPPQPSGEFDLQSIHRESVHADLEPVLSDQQARRLGILPCHQFVVWECVRSRPS